MALALGGTANESQERPNGEKEETMRKDKKADPHCPSCNLDMSEGIKEGREKPGKQCWGCDQLDAAGNSWMANEFPQNP